MIYKFSRISRKIAPLEIPFNLKILKNSVLALKTWNQVQLLKVHNCAKKPIRLVQILLNFFVTFVENFGCLVNIVRSFFRIYFCFRHIFFLN